LKRGLTSEGWVRVRKETPANREGLKESLKEVESLSGGRVGSRTTLKTGQFLFRFLIKGVGC
jgi:hypothetical protein